MGRDHNVFHDAKQSGKIIMVTAERLTYGWEESGGYGGKVET